MKYQIVQQEGREPVHGSKLIQLRKVLSFGGAEIKLYSSLGGPKGFIETTDGRAMKSISKDVEVVRERELPPMRDEVKSLNVF